MKTETPALSSLLAHGFGAEYYWPEHRDKLKEKEHYPIVLNLFRALATAKLNCEIAEEVIKRIHLKDILELGSGLTLIMVRKKFGVRVSDKSPTPNFHWHDSRS